MHRMARGWGARIRTWMTRARISYATITSLPKNYLIIFLLLSIINIPHKILVVSPPHRRVAEEATTIRRPGKNKDPKSFRSIKIIRSIRNFNDYLFKYFLTAIKLLKPPKTTPIANNKRKKDNKLAWK